MPEFQLPSLQKVDNTAFSLADGTRLDLASLQTFDTSSISFGFNSTFNAPQLLSFINSDLNLAPGKTINTPAFTNIYASRFSVSSGVTWTNCAATNYEVYANWNTSPTLFSADGAGSLLDVSSLKSLRVYGGSSGAYTYSITANNSGVVDLSGLEVMTGADPFNYGADDWLTLSLANGGSIRLSNLRQVSGRTRLVLGESTTLGLTNLTQMTSGCRVELGVNAAFVAPNLTRLADNFSITFGAGSSLCAPLLREFVNSDLSLGAGSSFTGAPFTNIYASRLSVSGGRSLSVAAVSYELPGSSYYATCSPYYRAYPPKNLFSADGAGSLLDLSSLKSVQVYGAREGYDSGWRNDWTYFITAANQGVIDLSGLEIVYGADPNAYICDCAGNCGYYGQDDWLSFTANNGGVIRLGRLSVNRRTSFSASGPNSALQFASLYLRPPATLNVGVGTELRIRGDFIFENTDTNSIVTELVRFQMDGALPQRLEVGGRDLGPLTAAYRRNFGYSQLVVGSTTNGSIVKLVDTLNNGGRGAAGEPEALYLYGMEGQGLRLLSGSRLMLNGLNCYAAVSGQMVNLRSLIPAGTNSVVFDGGFIGDFGGPIITNMTPSVAVTPPVSSVDVSFNMALQASSFTADDVSISGPGGLVTVTGVSLVGGTTWRISFVPQTADGPYTVRVGPNIDEVAGNFLGMDQNGNGLSGEATDVFSGTFIIDGTPPALLGAYALQNGNRVGLTFDEAVAPAFATNAANYFINGNAVTNAAIRTNGNQVVIMVSPLVGDTFELVANNVTDLLGNTANRTVTGTILPLEPRDIGSPGSDPRDTGSSVAFAETDFDCVGGGSAIWGTSDAFHFLFERRVGDFDVRVRVARQDKPAANNSDVGIMLRESLAANSRKFQATIEGNYYYFGVRYSTGGNVPSPYPHIPGVDTSNPGIPNAWIRLRRQSSVFSAFRGTNGMDWIEYGRVTNDFPTAAYLGLETCANNNNAGQAITASYRGYAEVSPCIITQPQSQAVASGSNVVFGVTARGLPTLAYQWFHDGAVVPGATDSLLTLGAVTTNLVGDYRVVVTNSFGAATSQVATLVVDGVGSGGFEADVSPAPYGNNVVTVSDWVKVGRFVAGLDTVASSSEFMRADCAPRTNDIEGTLPLGNGRLTVADWTQAGRYAAALDPLTPAGGTNAPAGFGSFAPDVKAGASYKLDGTDSSGRSIWAGSSKGVPGQVVSVPVGLEAQGDENALGFTLDFDPARLAYQSASLADGVTGVTLQINAQEAGQGRLGVLLGQSAGQTFAAGSRSLVQVRLVALGTPAAETPLAFGDLPVFREVVNATADPLAADYLSGTVRIVQAGHLAACLPASGSPLELTLTGQAGETYRIEVSSDLVQWSTLSTNKLGSEPVVVLDPQVGSYQRRFYRAVLQ